MRLEDGLEHDLVEALLLDLPSFSLLGSADGSSKLPGWA